MPDPIRMSPSTNLGLKTYEVKVRIKDLDYTNDIVGVTIISTLASAYQMVDVSLFLDPADVILNELFGGESIKLSVFLLREIAGYAEKIFDMDLIFLSSDFTFAERAQKSEEKSWDRTIVTVHTIPKDPYKSMTTLVNDVFIGQNLNSIISGLASKVGLASVQYDTEGQNTIPVDQVCIPPTTFYKIIKEATVGAADTFDGFLDQRFGLFDGVAGVFCDYKNNLYIKNLTNRIKMAQTLTIYQLASMQDGDNKSEFERIIAEMADGNVYYTNDVLESDYFANAKFGTISTNLNHIVKPANKLYAIINQDLEDIAKKYSLIYTAQGSPDFFIDPAIGRTRYLNEDTGNEEEQTIFNSKLSKSLADLSTIEMNIERHIELNPVMSVGDCVKFKPLTVDYQKFEGKYILFRSQIELVRKNNWMATANLVLIRSNKKK